MILDVDGMHAMSCVLGLHWKILGHCVLISCDLRGGTTSNHTYLGPCSPSNPANVCLNVHIIDYPLHSVILAATRKDSVDTLICASSDFRGLRTRDNPQLIAIFGRLPTKNCNRSTG